MHVNYILLDYRILRNFVGDKPNEKDNCPSKYNPDQRDIDHDGMGDVCDPHAYSAPVYPGQPPVTQYQTQQPPSLDRDGDSIPDSVSPGSPSVDRPVADNCPAVANKDQSS
jgi:hypothetical protein